MAPPYADGGAVAGTAVGFLSAQWKKGLQLDLELLYNLSRRKLELSVPIYTSKGHKHTSKPQLCLGHPQAQHGVQ